MELWRKFGGYEQCENADEELVARVEFMVLGRRIAASQEQQDGDDAAEDAARAAESKAVAARQFGHG